MIAAYRKSIIALILYSLFFMSCDKKAEGSDVAENKLDSYVVLTENIIDESAGYVSCYKIETNAAIYFLEKQGAGLSSLIDKDGNDWLSFHNKEGSGSSGEYRGFPNAVHQQDGSFFHPQNSGTDQSFTEITVNEARHIQIRAVSGTRTWECFWDFYPTHCTFSMTKKPPEYKYWILYEGTPGGAYESSDWWMMSEKDEKRPLSENYESDIPWPEWIAFGDKKLDRVLFLLHHQDDNFMDKFYQMNNQMTVFGFGRDGLTKFLNSVPQSFSIGFVESTNFEKINRTCLDLL